MFYAQQQDLSIAIILKVKDTYVESFHQPFLTHYSFYLLSLHFSQLVLAERYSTGKADQRVRKPTCEIVLAHSDGTPSPGETDALPLLQQ